jgi:hypothetical protein
MIIVQKKEMLLPLRLRPRIAGWYKLSARMLDGRVRPLTGWFPNLITNGGLDQLGQGGYPFKFCVVGTGNTAPANTDTQLVAQVAATTNIVSAVRGASSSSPWYGTTTTTWQFATGAAAGNLAEVGCGATATGLFSRALILDGTGSPTTITVLSSEALDVTYQAQMYSPSADVPGSVVLNGVNYTTNLRAAIANNPSWWALPTDQGGFGGIGYYGNPAYAYATQVLGAVTSNPSGTQYPNDSGSRAGYIIGGYSNNITVGWGINAGNISGGIGSVMLQLSCGDDAGFGTQGGGAYQVSFTPVIPKDNTKVLSLTFQVNWGRGT